MTTINCPTGKVNPKRAKTPLHFCNPHHKEPLPIERFLGIAYRKRGHSLRKSTRRIGIVLFHTLREGPQVVNIAQLARDTGYSQTTVSRAIKYFSKYEKVQRVNERRTGKRRPCMYKLHDSYTEKPEAAKPQEKGRCEVSHLSYSSLRESKETQTTKAKIQLLMESFNRIPRQNPLTEKQKKTGAFLIRFERKRALMSGLVDSLWRRNCVADIWQDVLTGLQGLDVVATDTELLWRSRKAVKALVQGKGVVEFRAIMQDQPASEQEAVKRDVARFDRRLAGLEKWGNAHGVTAWFAEKRSQLTRERNQAGRGLPGRISTSGFFKTIKEAQPQPQRPRGRIFHLSGFYTGLRKPLEGDALRRKKALAVKALQGHENPDVNGVVCGSQVLA